MYSEYQIRKSFIEVIKQALSEMDVPLAQNDKPGYSVIARNQQTMTHAYDCVIIDKTYMRQNGFQAHRIVKGYDAEGRRVFFKRKEWLETWSWQISVAHRRQVNDTVESLTGEDVANRLRIWLNSSDGAAVMRSRKDVPFAPFQVFELKLRPYKDDSDISQIEAIFDFKMNVVQFKDTEPVFIDNWDWEVHGV